MRYFVWETKNENEDVVLLFFRIIDIDCEELEKIDVKISDNCTEIKIHESEEIKSVLFGGDYVEVETKNGNTYKFMKSITPVESDEIDNFLETLYEIKHFVEKVHSSIKKHWRRMER